MIDVVIISDVTLYREGLVSTLVNANSVRVVGTSDCAPEGIAALHGLQPVVAIVDTTRNGLGALRVVREVLTGSKAIALAIDESTSEILQYVEAGAAAYVTCDASIAELQAVIQAVAQGEMVCPPRITTLLLQRLATRAESKGSAAAPALTGREQQVLSLICDGLTNKEIAQRCHIAEATVKNHVHHLLDKLQVRTRAQAAARATRLSRRTTSAAASA
jgi:DNA-binding NarL/FixJ family response regulator